MHGLLTDGLCSVQVNLRANELGPEGAKALGPAIAVSSSLTAVDLRLNFLGSQAEQLLRDCVKDRPNFDLKL